MSDLYTQDGVNVSLGDVASKAASTQCKNTYENSPIAIVLDMSKGNFRGPRSVRLKSEQDRIECSWGCSSDGIGTKIVLTDAAGFHHMSAYDFLAMASFDLVRYGGLPIYVTSVLDVSSLGESTEDSTFKAVLSLYEGLADAASEIGVIVLDGETAELSSLVGSDNENATLKYNWGGSVHGLYHPDRMITGEDLSEGQVIIAFKENGFRSNGLSSVRKALAMQFGDDWFTHPEAQDYIRQIAAPSVLYDKMFIEANGWTGQERINIHALIHLTGGSFGSKLGEDILFPKGLSAELHNLWIPPEIMETCANWRGMSDQDFYETWNAGQGALAIVDKRDVDAILALSEKHGHEAQVAGIVTPSGSKPSIVIDSKYHQNEKVTFSKK